MEVREGSEKVNKPDRLLACLLVCLFVCLFVCFLFRVFVCLFVCLFGWLFVCSFVCLCAFWFVCLFVCSSVCCLIVRLKCRVNALGLGLRVLDLGFKA